MFTENYSYFMIYYNNLSIYYVSCLLISIASIAFSWYFHFKHVPDLDKMDKDSIKKMETEIEPPQDEIKVSDDEKSCPTTPSKVSLLRRNTQEAIETITKSMTEEQLKHEREVEQQQLSAILELLKNQEEKFQVGSMEELEDQLRLYR